MDIVWLVLGFVALLVGIIFCIVPGLPGPPIAYGGMLLAQLTKNGEGEHPFTSRLLIIYAIVVVAVTILDYIVPIWGTKKFGGSKYASWGSMIGLVLGFFVMPWGIIAGPFLGAFVGELINNKTQKEALRAGFGAFIGFVAGTLSKIVACGFMMYHYFPAFKNAFQ